MRCLALAQAWQDEGGKATFVMRESTPALDERLRSERCEVVALDSRLENFEDAEQTAAIAREHGSEWVVVDGYGFGANYQRALKQRGIRVLWVDDNGDVSHYSADLVLNQNVHASEAFYRNREAHTRLLLGPRFALLRRDFRPWIGRKREMSHRAHRLLITMGGSDPDNVTAVVLEAVMSNAGLEADLVLGGSNPHRNELREAAMRYGGRVVLHENVNDMPRLIAGVDLAISGAGTTTLEMCLLGLPALLVVLADNQRLIAEDLMRRGAAINLGAGATLKPISVRKRLTDALESRELRTMMAEAGQKLVDGQGAERVARVLRMSKVVLRLATEQDCRLLWEMVNDPGVRASAFSPEPIPFDRHVSWYKEKLDSGRCHIFIGEADGAAVGQVRFDERQGGEADTDVSVIQTLRGAGLGAYLIEAAVREAFATTRICRVHAYIRPENTASQRAFETAGFQNNGEIEFGGQRAVHYLCESGTPPSHVGRVRE